MTGGKSIPDTGDCFRDMVETIRILRSPGGCPWDMKQNLEAAVENLLSEADEVREAMEKGNMENLKEELGDLLWGILFAANVARENDLFDIDCILKYTMEKIIRRHPHVFGGADARSPEQASRLFKEVKEMEKNAKKQQPGTRGTYKGKASQGKRDAG
jgi:uncharacterized protein YabN with tetrapyrrole methylase and pyrophosphatase domain